MSKIFPEWHVHKIGMELLKDGQTHSYCKDGHIYQVGLSSIINPSRPQ